MSTHGFIQLTLKDQCTLCTPCMIFKKEGGREEEAEVEGEEKEEKKNGEEKGKKRLRDLAVGVGEILELESRQ